MRFFQLLPEEMYCSRSPTTCDDNLSRSGPGCYYEVILFLHAFKGKIVLLADNKEQKEDNDKNPTIFDGYPKSTIPTLVLILHFLPRSVWKLQLKMKSQCLRDRSDEIHYLKIYLI